MRTGKVSSYAVYNTITTYHHRHLQSRGRDFQNVRRGSILYHAVHTADFDRRNRSPYCVERLSIVVGGSSVRGTILHPGDHSHRFASHPHSRRPQTLSFEVQHIG